MQREKRTLRNFKGTQDGTQKGRERAPPLFSPAVPVITNRSFFSFVFSKQDSQFRDIQIRKEGAKLFKRKIHFRHLNFTKGRGKVRKNIFHPNLRPNSFLPSYSAQIRGQQTSSVKGYLVNFLGSVGLSLLSPSPASAAQN